MTMMTMMTTTKMTGTTTCPACGGELRREPIPRFEDDLIGVPVVLVDAVHKETCTACGEELTAIPDLDGLIAAVAMALVRQAYKLNGREIRFLRKALDWSAKLVADKVGVSPETVSRWENDASAIADANERLLRLNVGLALAPRVPAIDFAAEDVLGLQIAAERPADLPPRELRRFPLKVPRQPIEQRRAA